ncbi:MAG TPA: AAA family ATPase [Gemmatimonadaceae bacterium]|nr:AAA family ATPase [Gemmatimonadaceae bacterium]
MTPSTTSTPPTLPLVGRATELATLGAWLDGVAGGRGGTMIVAGGGGVGKTRLAAALAERATRQGWAVTVGQAYPVETGVPYAIFGDALLPFFRKMDRAALEVLTRGGSAELAYICPALAVGGEGRESSAAAQPVGREPAAESKARLLWSFAQLLARAAARQPLLLVLENLQWADSSSLELLHFTARQIASHRVALLCTYNESELDQSPTLRAAEQSLLSLGAARLTRLEPLSHADTEALVRETFGADAATTREFAAKLYSWTRGNPFFVGETLKALVESGQLHRRDGVWLGWEVEALALPRSVRDAVLVRVNRLGAGARAVANMAAVVGARVSHEALVAISGRPEPEVLEALDELRDQGIFAESADGGVVRYDFSHPMMRDVLYRELGIVRARMLHATVAEALEALYARGGRRGDSPLAHADELAFHFSRAEARGLAPKAVKYLAAAGRAALARYANREAADYLAGALDRLDGDSETTPDADGTIDDRRLIEDLARARQRLGDYDAAMALWQRARADAIARGEPARLAAIERRMGLGCYWSGRYHEALAHYEAGTAAASEAKADVELARLQLAKGVCLQALGRPAEAQTEVQGALVIAERLGNEALLARVHRALLLLYVWTGPASLAREHGGRAIELARSSGQRNVEWSAHWAMAMLEGLTGNGAAITRYLAESERLADELHSPLLRVWTAEVAIEYASGIGEWATAIALAERTIATARALSQRTLLPRLLVWAAVVYVGRGEFERAKAYLDEAWTLSGAGTDASAAKRPLDVHQIVPVHAGLTTYYVATGEYRKAIDVGVAGLAIADRSGYVAWAVHRLLPMIIEAALWLQDFHVAGRYRERLRRDSQRLGHRLGLAWADTCDALMAMMHRDDRDVAPAIAMLRKAADDLEAIPWALDAARVRRKLAEVLASHGDREGATRELRHVHDVFVRLGAERELTITRDVIRELGLRPPARTLATGANGLTGREIDIARLAAARKSNKEIGAALGISPRTVSTHLSNVFAKLGVGSRSELTDVAREQGLLEGAPNGK